MSLNIQKLENVNDKSSRIIARCPACAEQGNDNKGEHLFINEQGCFSCVMYPGAAGEDHRKRIFALVGVNRGESYFRSSQKRTVIKVRAVDHSNGNVIKSNVLGHLGRVNQTLKKHNENDIKERIYNKDFEKAVPAVPVIELKTNTNNVTTETEEQTTVEIMCDECGLPAITHYFGETESGKFDWMFYCNECNPHTIDCSECNSPAIFYVDSSGNSVFDKCNVHGERLKPTNAQIEAYSRERERKMSYIT